jgi:hypothetical protein
MVDEAHGYFSRNWGEGGIPNLSFPRDFKLTSSFHFGQFPSVSLLDVSDACPCRDYHVPQQNLGRNIRIDTDVLLTTLLSV